MLSFAIQLSNVYRRQICGILELESYLTSPPWFRLNASKLLASKLFVLFYKVAHKLEAVCDTRVFAANGYMDLCARRTLGWTRYIYICTFQAEPVGEYSKLFDVEMSFHNIDL